MLMSEGGPTAGRERQERHQAAQEEQARAAWMLACDLAARQVDADVREVVQTRGTPGRGSSNKVALARKLACYVALVVSNADAACLARVAGLHRKTLSDHAAWVEDRRDDPRNPEFEAMVARLEDALCRMALRIVMQRLGVAPPPATEEAA